MKKLLALAIVGGFLALMTGCPPATTKVPSTGGPAPATSPPKETKDTVKDTVKDTTKDTSKDTTKDTTKTEPKTHEGKVVKAADGKLTMKDTKDKEMIHTLSKDATITVDGKPAKLEDLKADMTITVTMDGETVTKIEAKK